MLKKQFAYSLQKKKCAFLFLLFLSVSIFSFAQQKITVSGTVVSDSTLPLSNVSIQIKGEPGGITSEANGAFTIKVNKGATLVFSMIGYEEKQIRVEKDNLALAMQLSAISSTLNSVIVIGYGSQIKRNITGAVSSIDVSKLKDIPSANVTQLLDGQAAGVTVQQATGSPGREFNVTIRGMGSLGAGSAPLYVVDGFPVGTSIGQNINPADIKTITILKDAVSTAIYGARGSNGVILITTKNARNGEVSLTASANYGIQNIPESRKTKVLDGAGFARFKKDNFMDKIRYFENREPAITEVPLDYRFPDQTKHSTNWFNEILNNNAPYQDYNIALSNGKGAIKSLVSLGYLNQDGTLINTNYKLYSVRANVGGQLNNFINMGVNLNGSYSNQTQASTEGRDNLVGSTYLMDPRDPVYNSDGSYNNFIGGHDGTLGFANPVQALKEANAHYTNTNVITNAFLEFSFLKNFKFKTAVNVGLYVASAKQFTPSTVSGIGQFNAPAPRDATESDGYSYRTNISADQLLTYSKEFGYHHLDVLAGYTAQEETEKYLNGNGSQYPGDLVPYLNAAVIKTSSSGEFGWSSAAYFGRANYSYKGKYLLSGTFRREGSSRFGSLNKWGDFPALSVGWRISDEKFMPKFTWLNDLKLRGSWGVTGNNNIGNYSSLSFMNASNYIFGNSFSSGQVVSSFANTQLGWEKSKQTDIGIDLSAFDNKLTFTAEYYNRITSDMLLSVQLPAISGFTSSLGNVGKVQNNGFELSAGYKTKINEIGLWGNFNIAFNRNKVLAIRGVNDEIWNGGFYDVYSVSKVGRPMGMMYGYKVLGIFQNQSEIDKSPAQDGVIPGMYKYADASGDGKISYDTKDMVEIGNPWPKGIWGFTLGGTYKNFDMSVLLTGKYGYNVAAQIEKSTENLDGVFNVLTESVHRWRSEQNPGAGKLTSTNTWKYQRESNSRYIYSGSHLWVKNVSLGYSIPKSTVRFSAVRLYISAQNLFLITKYPGSNPDVNNSGGTSPGIDDSSYPLSRTFSIGANISL